MYYLLSRPWVNMIGKFETPHVIGKCANPRALKNVRSLPSVWRHDKPAWMTSKLFEEAVSRFSEMRREGRHVLLFLDNAPCHPKLTFTNVKLVFFPANMTSHIQPLDQGIIQDCTRQYWGTVHTAQSRTISRTMPTSHHRLRRRFTYCWRQQCGAEWGLRWWPVHPLQLALKLFNPWKRWESSHFTLTSNAFLNRWWTWRMSLTRI